jgi:hypothetical protein
VCRARILPRPRPPSPLPSVSGQGRAGMVLAKTGIGGSILTLSGTVPVMRSGIRHPLDAVHLILSLRSKFSKWHAIVPGSLQLAHCKCVVLELSHLGKICLRWAEFWHLWNPLGTLWKGFSWMLPHWGSRTGIKWAGNKFHRHMSFSFSRLIASRFKNLSIGLTPLWKPDCNSSSES